MFEEVQKRQRRQLAGLGWVMVLFGGGVTAIGVSAVALPDEWALLSPAMTIRGLVGGLLILGLGVVSIYRARKR